MIESKLYFDVDFTSSMLQHYVESIRRYIILLYTINPGNLTSFYRLCTGVRQRRRTECCRIRPENWAVRRLTSGITRQMRTGGLRRVGPQISIIVRARAFRSTVRSLARLSVSFAITRYKRPSTAFCRDRLHTLYRIFNGNEKMH